MRRLVLVIGLAAAASMSAGPLPARGELDPTSEAARRASLAIVDDLASRTIPMTPARVDELAAIVDERAAAEPGESRWRFGQAVIAWRRQEMARAREIMLELVAKEPRNAEYQTTLGTITFQGIIGQRDLAALGLAEEGVEAYERSLELDGSQTEPRVGIGIFSSAAPALAGGSYRKAREQAEALRRLPDGKGEYAARIVLAQIAQSRERWDEMTREHRAAESAPGEGGGPVAAKLAHAGALLTAKKDAAAALEITGELEALTGESHPFWPYVLALRGQALARLERWAEAERALTRSAELNTPTAPTLLELARSLDQLGRASEAREAYATFERRYPRHSSASEVRRAIRRLDRALAR